MNKRLRLALLIGIPLLGILAGYLLMGRTVQVVIDGKSSEVHTRALTVRGALRSAGLRLTPSDLIIPSANIWLSKATIIEVDRSRIVTIWVDPGGSEFTLNTAAKTPAEILADAGITPADEDVVKVNGQELDLNMDVPSSGAFVLQYLPTIPLTVEWNAETVDVLSAAPTIGQALWNAGIQVRGGDALDIPFESPFDQARTVKIQVSRQVFIDVDGKTIGIFTSAETVGEALRAAGVPLEDLDYSKPGSTKPIPDDGNIKVVRVKEEILVEQTVIAFQQELVPDDTLEVNDRKVIQVGESGSKVSRVRVRYEDGQEISRVSEADIILKQPVTEIIHYGSKLTYNTIDTPYGKLTYYLALNMTATSYSPCNSDGAAGKCYPITAMGTTVQQGVVALKLPWYRIFKGSRVYVPGYGVATVADNGTYPYTDYWIDLGYSDADYVPWPAVSVTVYFLEPAPSAYTGVLP